MVRPDLLAEYLSNIQPQTIRDRILNNGEFCTQFKLLPASVATIGQNTQIDQKKLLNVVRQVLGSRNAQGLKDFNGQGLVVECGQNAIIIRGDSEENKLYAQISELMVLSPNNEERMLAFSKLISQLGPTSSEFTEMRTSVQRRGLNDKEFEEILSEKSHGVTAVQARVHTVCDANNASINELVPDSIKYFEDFCGPEPKDMDIDDYLKTTLIEYRKKIINRDLIGGLNISLLGNLRDDISPVYWLKDISDDKLWDALIACDPQHDPVSLLSAIDIAIDRQHDDRFSKYAEDFVPKLLKGEFLRPDGVDVYELETVFADLILNRINSIENGARLQPAWKNMCAWMHAGLLVRFTRKKEIDLESFMKWSNGIQTPSGVYAKILDLRSNPLYKASEFSRDTFYCEIIGRLQLVKNRHESTGKMLSFSKDIEAVVSKYVSKGGGIMLVMPGPLEGHSRPANIETRKLPDKEKKFILKELTDGANPNKCLVVAYHSQYFYIGSEILEKLREIMTDFSFSNESIEVAQQYNLLEYIGLTAVAQQDVQLAKIVLTKILYAAQMSRSEIDVMRIISILLVTSGVFEDEKIWANWLADQLEVVAIHLKTDKLSEVLYTYLQELKKVVKLSLGVCSKAEAIAASAM